MKRFKMSNNKGITLVALVVTIIILIILAGISLNILLKENGVINKAKEAKITQDVARIQESLELLKAPILVNEHGVNLDSYLAELQKEENYEKYKVTRIEERAEGANYVYAVLENKYRYKIEDTLDGNVVITYEGLEADLLLSEYTGTFIYPETKTIEVTRNASGGTLSVISSNENIAKATISGTTITIEAGTTTGTATITVKSQKDNDEDIATYKAEVRNKAIEVTATKYEGIYDGEVHGILVTTIPTDAKVEYSDGTKDSEGNLVYSSTNPTYKNVGEYTVYYKASKEGYQTVSGSLTVIIMEADGSLTVDPTSATYAVSGTFEVKNNVSGGDLTVDSSNENAATAEISGNTVTVTPKIISAPTTVDIIVTSAATQNHKQATAVHKAKILGTIDYTAEGKEVTYDGSEHSISVSTTTPGTTITYSTDGTNFSSTKPTYKDVGEYTVYYKITKEDYKTASSSLTVKIGQADGNLTVDPASATYSASGTFEVKNNVSGGGLTVDSSNKNAATATISGNTVTVTPKIISTPTTVDITVTSAATGNHKEATAVHKAKILGTIDYTAEGKEVTYDGSEHSISVSTTTSGTTIEYSTNGTSYSTTKPTYTNVGEYTVHYKITATDYKPVSGTLTVKITEANGSLTVEPASATYSASGTFEVKNNVSGGDLTVDSSNKNAATATISGNTVTVTPKIISTPTTVDIIVTSAATGNHKEATAVHKAKILGTIDYTASGKDVTYDGSEHSINVTTTTPGATITYSTDGTNFSATNPTYTNVGEYTVYYKITATDYKTASSSLTVKIGQADGSLTVNPTSANYSASGTFTVSNSVSGTTLSVASSNENAATATISGSTVTVTPKTITAPTTVNITVTRAATQNYKAATAVHTAKILGTIQYSATKYEGTYDGSAHGITVTSTTSGATITYSSDGTTYSATKPTYTDVGEYTTYYKITATDYKTVTGSLTVKLTQADGSLTVNPTSANYSASGTFTVSNSVSGTTLSVASSNENAATATISGSTVTVTPKTITAPTTVNITVTRAATQNYKAATAVHTAKILGTIQYSVSKYEGTYDGSAHGITVTSTTSGATITYSSDGTNFSSTKPTYTNVGEYTTYYKITATDYKTVTGSLTVKLTQANGSLTVNPTSANYSASGTFTVNNSVSGTTLSVTSSNQNAATATISGNTVTVTPKTITAPTTVNITVTRAATQNYKAATAVHTAKILGTIQYSATKYEGTYDGSAHGITVTSTTSGATITYSSDGTTYSATKPTYTDVGEYTTYYKITATDYKTVTGSLTVKLTQANGSLTVNPTSANYSASGTFTVNNSVSGTTLSVTSSNQNAATATISGNTVTVTPKTITAPTTVNITVTRAATQNYKAATAVHTAKILGTIQYSASKYEGTYDGSAHGINVSTTTSGATITYSSDGTNFSSTKPTYTNVGEYTTYYKITATDYKTVTGSLTVKLTQANGSLTVNPTSANYSASGTFTVSNSVSGTTLSVASSNENAATATISGSTVTVTPKTITAPTTVNITVTRAATQNYKAATAVHTAKILGTIQYSVSKYEGTYDGSAHGITVTSTTSGATITYSSDGTNYSSTKPTYTDIGTYTTYYKITATDYKTVSGSLTVKITDSTSRLTVGQYVRYNPTPTTFTMTTTQTGYSSDQTFSTGDYTGLWRVLYNDSTNGLQLISADSVGYLYLTGATGYNNVVTTLNSFSSNYVNTTYASSARSVGTNPTSSSTDTSSTVSLVFNTSTGLKAADTRYTTDLAVMTSDMKNIGGYYWLPSRYVFSTSEVGYFGIYTVSTDGTAEYRRMKDLYRYTTDNYEYTYAYGVRPVVKLKDGITLKSGTGTSSNPYEI